MAATTVLQLIISFPSTLITFLIRVALCLPANAEHFGISIETGKPPQLVRTASQLKSNQQLKSPRFQHGDEQT